MKKRKYSVIRNYKKFKKEYLYFVLFIKCGEYYYTFDSDAKIMMYIYNNYREGLSFRIEKCKFKDVLHKLLDSGINVVLAGYKNTTEYYSLKENKYDSIKRLSKAKYKSTVGGVNILY